MTAIRSPENEAFILNQIVEGKTLREIASVLMCRSSAIAEWMSDDSAFAERIARARSIAAHAIAESVVEIADNAVAGVDNPQLVQNRCNQRRWLAGRFNQMYADQQKTDVNVRISWETLIQQSMQQVEAPTIEHAPQPSPTDADSDR